jgi:hypothetical protein
MRRVLLVLGLAGLAGCATIIPEPTMEMAGGDAGAFEALRAGRGVYVNKCSGCHTLIAPERHSDGEWRKEVEEMIAKKKVKLGPEDRESLLRYLSAANGRD